MSDTIKSLKEITLGLRKARDPIAPSLQFHLSEIANIGKANNRDTTEDEAITYLKKAVSKLKDNEFHNVVEAQILENLLPQMASADEVRQFVFHLEATEGLDISNKGAVMKAVKAEFGVRVDMKMVASML
jgi:uncharacterized protein YqeY